jgi:hypothetical protein
MRIIFILLSLSLVLVSCARRTQSPQTADLQADKKLSAKYGQDEAEEAQKSLEESQEKQRSPLSPPASLPRRATRRQAR